MLVLDTLDEQLLAPFGSALIALLHLLKEGPRLVVGTGTVEVLLDRLGTLKGVVDDADHVVGRIGCASGLLVAHATYVSHDRGEDNLKPTAFRCRGGRGWLGPALTCTWTSL